MVIKCKCCTYLNARIQEKIKIKNLDSLTVVLRYNIEGFYLFIIVH